MPVLDQCVHFREFFRIWMQTNWAEFTGVTELAKQDLMTTSEKFGLILEKGKGRNLNVYKRQFQEGKERNIL